jgi:hypothetical protein
VDDRRVLNGIFWVLRCLFGNINYTFPVWFLDFKFVCEGGYDRTNFKSTTLVSSLAIPGRAEGANPGSSRKHRTGSYIPGPALRAVPQ